MMDYQIRLIGDTKFYRPKRVVWGGQVAIYEDENGSELAATRCMIEEIKFDEQVKETG